jgi:hypothetical protein
MGNPAPVIIQILTTDQLEAAWEDKCPGCGAVVSAIKHDFSLCTRLNNAEYRIRVLERELEETKISQTLKTPSSPVDVDSRSPVRRIAEFLKGGRRPADAVEDENCQRQ